MKFDVYRVPFSCYPRCQHAHKYLKQLSDRYDDLSDGLLPLEQIPIPVDNPTPEFNLCIQMLETSSKGRIFKIRDVLKRNEKFQHIGTIKCDNVKDLICSNAYLKEAYSILLIKEIVTRDDVLQYDNVQTIIVTENIKDRNKALEYQKDSQYMCISLNDSISDQISNVMEQNIFKAFKMKIKCENLLKTLNGIPQIDARQEKSTCFGVGETKSQIHNKYSSKKRSKSLGNISLQGNVPRIPTRRSMSVQDSSLDTLNTLKNAPKSMTGRKDTSQKHINEHIERFERLYDEMKGMFTRSHVPIDEQPLLEKQFDGTVSNKLKEDLRQLSSSIRGFGYRFRSVLVFVDDKCDQEKLKPDIERILIAHNVSTFTIVSSSVKGLSSCNVGSEVAAEFGDGTVKYGTLGGFGLASTDKGDNRICLVSRHVVTDVNGDPASALKVSKDENATKASIIVDKSISSKRNTVLDIAAASFENDESQFDTKYKTSEDKAAKGRLSEYRLEELKGLPVHICGSKTPMGYGTITVPKVEAVQDCSMNDFIIIEDRENPHQERISFCADGDSGSIVCADDQENPDKVQLISMVMGEDTKKTGTYYSLNLEKGINQVKEEAKANIQLL